MAELVVPIFATTAGDTDTALAAASRAARLGADAIEWRVDQLASVEQSALVC